MSRAALIGAALALWAAPARAVIDPHMDPTLVPSGCMACHRGHGASPSSILPKPQTEVCLGCHGTAAGVAREQREGNLAFDAHPVQLATVLAKPFLHPLTGGAFSEHEPDAVTCTSCHSPHRGRRSEPTGDRPTGRPRLSVKDPGRFAYETCQSCHGSAGISTQSYLDLSRLLDPSNRSYHPVLAPAVESSPSVDSALAGGQVNCTDCHGNDDPEGARGVHGSEVRYLLRDTYTTVDGSTESPAAYGLCYVCHDRQVVLGTSRFPDHARHIVDRGASCATCHNPHGSVRNRALIRFGEETTIGGVSPSVSTGRLAFVSDAPGSGRCYLTCHGYDHAPEAYGMPGFVEQDPGSTLFPAGAATELPPSALDPRDRLPPHKTRRAPRDQP